jgi:DNA helicase HerA-like ATPase
MTETFALNYSDLHNPSIVSGSGAFAEYILPTNNSMKELSIGTTILIKDKRDKNLIWMTGTVIEMKSLSPFIADRDILLYNKAGRDEASSILHELSGPHSEQRLIARIQILSELVQNIDGSYIQTPVQQPASNWSRLILPKMVATDSEIPTLQDILGLKRKGVHVGYIGAGNFPQQENKKLLSYNLDVINLDNKHMFIVGESGSGKTVLLKKLAYELRRSGSSSSSPKVIITDVQGDFLHLLMPDVIKPIQRTGWQNLIEKSETEEALQQMGPFQLIYPMPKNHDKKTLMQLKTVIENNGHKVVEIGLRMQDVENASEIEYLLRLSSEQAVAVMEDEMEAMQAAGGTVTLDNLENRIQSILNNAGEEKQPATSTGVGYYKSTFRAVLRGLRQLRNVFDHHEPSKLTHLNPLECLKFDGTSVFYLEHLDPEERLMWGMQLVKWLYENKREKGEFFVFIDEAHQLIPAKPPTAGKGGTFPRLRDNFEKLAREGRKFGINLILGTQSPRDLHEIVPQQCPTRIVMKIDKGNARAAHIEEGEARIASQFGQGQMFLRSPFNGTSEWIRVHSEAPPLPHESMTKFWDKLADAAKSLI